MITVDSLLQVVKSQLFNEKQFRAPTYGRSNVPFNSILDHPGIWENASQAYLHEVLIRKKGIAATLAIIFAQVRHHEESQYYSKASGLTILNSVPPGKETDGSLLAQVMQNLIACGAISFAVRIDCSELDRYQSVSL